MVALTMAHEIALGFEKFVADSLAVAPHAATVACPGAII